MSRRGESSSSPMMKLAAGINTAGASSLPMSPFVPRLMEGEESDSDCGDHQQCNGKSFQSFPREIAGDAVNFAATLAAKLPAGR